MRYTLLLLALCALNANAASIAVIDSGTDWKHPALSLNYLMNEAETPSNKIDDDKNGYIDDTHGWNFAEQNNQVIDYSYLGKFSPEINKFFEVQTRMLEGVATESEKEWLKSKRDDQEFLKQLQVFGNFAHGTHVSGIAAKDQHQNYLFAVKLIPTEVKLPFARMFTESRIFSSPVPMASGFKDMLFASGLGLLAKQQSKLLGTIGAYVNLRKADVANGSFGTGSKQARMIVETLYKAVFKKEEQNEEHLMGFVKHFMTSLIMESKAFVDAAPKTLFVFAAGNDGTNNDEMPTSPANIRADNSITVAATLHNRSLAVFSNFGEKMVDIAAPGVGIVSAIPGTEMMTMSGTSQASPYVANVAAVVKTLNPSLKPSEIKMILMATVDKKAWLKGKVASGGFVNPQRAAVAAELSVSNDIYVAVAKARESVKDLEIATSPQFFRGNSDLSLQDVLVAPLPSPIY